MNQKEKIYKISSIILIIDQILKLLINNKMKEYQNITIIPNFFSIFYVKNTGAAFSILENSTSLIIIISVIFLIILDRTIVKEKLNKTSIISLGMVIGGIYGNLIDRIIHRGVIDYLSFSIFKYHFPIFNLADINITIGIIILIGSTFIEKKRK